MIHYNYYEDQLNLIKNTFDAKFKVTTEENSTKWLDLNEESAKALIEWLNKNFNLQ